MTDKTTQKHAEEFENLMMSISRAFKSDMIECCDLNVTMPQFFLLISIQKNESPKMSDLANELGVTLGNITSMIDRLIDQSLVVRTSDPDDRRVVRVGLTNEGKSLMKKASDRKRKNFEVIMEKISVKDRENLFGIMKRLADAL